MNRKAPKKDWYRNFWSKVDKENPCWIWKGSTRYSSREGKGGIVYGTAWHMKKLKPAHKVSWELTNNREVPSGFLVLHKCDVYLCVNPSHLFIGTHGDNMRDMVMKGRHYKNKNK